MARSTLTTTIQRIQALAEQVQSLPPEEYHYFLDLIDPQPEEAPAKKARKKRGTKSTRASCMAAAIKNSIEAQKQANTGADEQPTDSKPLLCGACGNVKDFEDHQLGSKSYHEFDPGKPKTPKGACAFVRADKSICGLEADSLVHDPLGGYASYHPFDPGKPVVRAPRKSRTKPGEGSSAPSSEIEKADAGNVALGVSAGD